MCTLSCLVCLSRLVSFLPCVLSIVLLSSCLVLSRIGLSLSCLVIGLCLVYCLVVWLSGCLALSWLGCLVSFLSCVLSIVLLSGCLVLSWLGSDWFVLPCNCLVLCVPPNYKTNQPERQAHKTSTPKTHVFDFQKFIRYNGTTLRCSYV
jgi:hypothetical protein